MHCLIFVYWGSMECCCHVRVSALICSLDMLGKMQSCLCKQLVLYLLLLLNRCRSSYFLFRLLEKIQN